MEIDIVSIKKAEDLSDTKLYHARVTIGGIKMDANYMTNPNNGYPHLTVEEFTELIKEEYGKVL